MAIKAFNRFGAFSHLELVWVVLNFDIDRLPCSMKNLCCLGVFGSPQIYPANFQKLISHLEPHCAGQAVTGHRRDEDSSKVPLNVHFLNFDPKLFTGLLNMKLSYVSCSWLVTRPQSDVRGRRICLIAIG